MPRSPGRTRSKGKADAFGRVFEMVERAAGSVPSSAEARRRFSDLVRIAGRLRQLERRLGRKGIAELSPYVASLLRLVSEPRVVAPARLRRAVSF